jgi:hypothetical protein
MVPSERHRASGRHRRSAARSQKRTHNDFIFLSQLVEAQLYNRQVAFSVLYVLSRKKCADYKALHLFTH